MPHSFGVPVPSDWADKADDDPVFGLYKNCGCWTESERAILGACASQFLGKPWVDIGCHTGLTSKVINWHTNGYVACVDPMLAVYDFWLRWRENTAFPPSWAFGCTSNDFFKLVPYDRHWSGAVIDGDHEPGKPLEDAKNALACLAETGVILLHDALGLPVREAAVWLMDQGMKARWYDTPHGVIVCWRGDFTPPEHVPDVGLPDLRARCEEFPFERCS
jgi:hypothetical protein